MKLPLGPFFLVVLRDWLCTPQNFRMFLIELHAFFYIYQKQEEEKGNGFRISQDTWMLNHKSYLNTDFVISEFH